MLKKSLFATALALKVTLAAAAGYFFSTAPQEAEPTLRADCPMCMPIPDCFPGDGCMDCY